MSHGINASTVEVGELTVVDVHVAVSVRDVELMAKLVVAAVVALVVAEVVEDIEVKVVDTEALVEDVGTGELDDCISELPAPLVKLGGPVELVGTEVGVVVPEDGPEAK